MRTRPRARQRTEPVVSSSGTEMEPGGFWVMSIPRGNPPGRVVLLLEPNESATLEALRLRGLSLGKTARVASRLFGRKVAKSTVQQYLFYRARRQERDCAS